MSNSMKLSHAHGTTQDRWVMVERSDRMWSTGEGNGKPLQYLCLENPMLLLLSHFSRVRLCETLQMAAHQALMFLGFSRQEYWSGLPFLSPMHESESEVIQSYPTLSDPIDNSPPGSSVHGIFQARTLEWVAISISISSLELCIYCNSKITFIMSIFYVTLHYSEEESNPHSES